MQLNIPKNIQSIQFFSKNLNFPICVYICSEWEKSQVNYLAVAVKEGIHTSYSICQWCKHHKISYQIIYPIKKSSIIKNPYKFLKYLSLKNQLKSK